MEVSSYLHAPAALSGEKEPPVPIYLEVGWAQSQYGLGGDEKVLTTAVN